MNDSIANDSCNIQQSDTSRIVFGSILIGAASVGTVGNSILSFYVIRHTEMQSLINMLLATMAISDTLISCLCAPFDFYASLSGVWPFGKVMCLAHSFLLSALVVQNVTIFVIISIDRYFILVHKRDHLRGCSVAALITACVVFSNCVSCPPLFGRGRMIFTNEYCRRMFEKNDKSYVYPLLYSNLFFVLPCGLLLLAYVHIIVIIRKTKRRVCPAVSHRASVSSTKKHVRINLKFKEKTFSTILCLYAAAVVCKLPLAVSIFLRGLTTYAMCGAAHSWIMLLTYLNSAINPLIYASKINEYWMMLTGKFSTVKDQVKSFRRKSRLFSHPQEIYVITTDARTSVI